MINAIFYANARDHRGTRGVGDGVWQMENGTVKWHQMLSLYLAIRVRVEEGNVVGKCEPFS